jgi:hypothetical protein
VISRLMSKGLIAVLIMTGAIAGFAAVPTAVTASVAAASTPEPANSVGNRTGPKSPNPVDQTAGANPLWATPLKALSATRERPIFSPSRRPPAPVVAAAPSAATPQPIAKPIEPERPQLFLVGTVVNDTEGIGIFLDQLTNRTISLTKGQSQKGWILRDVRRREVILQKDKQAIVLAMPVRFAAPAAAPTTEVTEAEITRNGRR